MRAREEIHEGVTDEEFVAALKVLQRMIHNVGGRPGTSEGAGGPGLRTPTRC